MNDGDDDDRYEHHNGGLAKGRLPLVSGGDAGDDGHAGVAVGVVADDAEVGAGAGAGVAGVDGGDGAGAALAPVRGDGADC